MEHPYTEIVEYLKSQVGRNSHPLPYALEEHVKTCSKCRRILETPRLQESLLWIANAGRP